METRRQKNRGGLIQTKSKRQVHFVAPQTLRRNRKGSILLEAILALLFITLMVGAVAGLFSHSMAKVRQAEFRTRAMLLAETKLAELQTGIEDITEGKSGDFNGKPENFTWQIEEENVQTSGTTDTSTSENSELKRLKLTINYTDSSDGFTYSIYRLYSSSLNLSAEKIKAISDDPTQIQSLSGSSSSMQQLIEMLGEFTGGDQLLNSLLKGGVPAMMALYSKVVSGKISAEELMSMLEETTSDTTSGTSSLETAVSDSSSSETSGGVPWTDYDTAGTGEKPTTQSSSGVANTGDKSNTTTQPGNSTATTDNTNTTSTDTDTSSSTSTGSMTREQAIKKMEEMLRRLANKKK